LFSPEKFSVYATDLNVQEQLKSNASLSKESAEGKAFIKEMEAYNLARANKIRSSFLNSLLTTFSSIVLGVILGSVLKKLFGSPSIFVLNLFQMLGVGILLSATLSVLSHEIESYGKSTLAEKINKTLFKAQYVLGSFLFFLAYSWSV
jgi:F0F1-type ATP synthase assembly protein I